MPPARGTAIHCSALCEQEVRDIRRRYANYLQEPCSLHSLAEEYDVTHAAIWRIVTGRSWKWVQDGIEYVPHPQAGPGRPRQIDRERLLALRASKIPYKLLARMFNSTADSLKVIASNARRDKRKGAEAPKLP